jgi:O-antigen/teichoic acid export membrane protein
MEFKSLIKNTSFMMVTRIAQFAAGLVTTKISALLLGTSGIGIINQLNFLTQKMSQFTTLSMVEAVVKQIAENKVDKNANGIISSAFKSYIILVSSFSIISIALLLIFSNALTNYVFGEGDFIAYFFIVIFTFPLLIISSIPFAILTGFRDIKLISQIRIGIVFTNLLFAVPLIYYFRLDGAVAYVPISYLVDLLFHFIVAQKLYFQKLGINVKSICNASFRTDFVKELFYFSGFGITVGTYAIFSEFICRSIVVSHLGVEQIGLYSPVIMWASMMTGFLLPALSTYLYPRFCELNKTHEITGLLNDALRLGSIVIIPLLLIGIPFRELIITLFYSKEFIGAAKFLPYHFLGLLFYVWWYVFAQAMTPTGRIRQHGIFQILFFTLDMLVTYYFVNNHGLYGWMLKQIVSPFVFFFVYYFYAYKKMEFSISKENSILMGFALISSLILILLMNLTDYGNKIAYILGPLFLISSYFFLKKEERTFINEKYRLMRIFLFKK